MKPIVFYPNPESFYFGDMDIIKKVILRLANKYTKDYFSDVFLSYSQLEKFYKTELLCQNNIYKFVTISFHDCGSDFWTDSSNMASNYEERSNSHNGVILIMTFETISFEDSNTSFKCELSYRIYDKDGNDITFDFEREEMI